MTAPVFVIGATRSGTSWLQKMLGAHPEIATPQELDLFTGYLDPWEQAWARQLPESADLWHRHRHKGLPSVLEEEELLTIGRGVVERVHERVLALKPGARVVVEKEPGYTVRTELILRYFPEARFVHVIRDGRDVVASLLSASRGWGRSWAASSAERAAEIWRANVVAGRGARERTDAYTEVRYEEIDAAELARLFAFCGVDDDAALAERIRTGSDIETQRESGSALVWGGEVVKRLGGAPAEPDGFFGEGRAEVWRDALSPYDRWVVDRVAGDLLVELGYAADHAWARLPLPRAASASARRAVAGAATRLRFAAGAARAELARRGAA